MNHKTADCRRSFTLIELLVVMSVVAILAGMLVPILASSRRAAKRAGTKNTISQVSVAINQFSEDFGRFPPDQDTDLVNFPLPLPAPPKTAITPPGSSPERLFFYLARPDLSAKHPYLEPQAGVQTCNFKLVGSGRTIQPDESAAQTNTYPQIADGWQHPIYYDITSKEKHGPFDIWSGGPNLKNDNGDPGTDDIRHW
jgi:prepilin-type N-terminal cleavage/methylation domain-containing protein